jgi:hypothetical protein
MVLKLIQSTNQFFKKTGLPYIEIKKPHKIKFMGLKD